MQRYVDITLAVTILAGAVFLWRSTATRSELALEHERLVNKVGHLPIRDPAKVHLLAIDTGDPHHFAWRAYFPPNYHYSYSCSSGGGSGSISSAWEGILRVRIRDVNGQPQLYYHLLNGSGLRSFGSGYLSKQLKEPAGKFPPLVAEQFAKDKLVTFDPTEARTLIKLKLTDESLADAKSQLKDWELRKISPVLEWIRIGPPGFRDSDIKDEEH